jgi:hypothetical protein
MRDSNKKGTRNRITEVNINHVIEIKTDMYCGC